MSVLLYAVYRRQWRLVGAAVLFAVVNPLLFSPPENEGAWMTRVVLAERQWTRERRATVRVIRVTIRSAGRP